MGKRKCRPNDRYRVNASQQRERKKERIRNKVYNSLICWFDVSARTYRNYTYIKRKEDESICCVVIVSTKTNLTSFSFSLNQANLLI